MLDSVTAPDYLKEAPVVIVDDEASIKIMLQQQWQHMGVSVETLGSEEELVTRLETKSPASLFMVDIMIPGANGLVLVRKIREVPEFAKVPIVIMSGLFTEDALNKVRGVFPLTAVLAKPFELTELLEAVDSLTVSRPAPVEAAYRLVVDHESLIVALHPVAPASPGSIEALSDVKEALKEEEVTFGIDQETMEKAFSGGMVNYEQDGSIIIARGRPVKHGQHGKVDFHFDVTGKAVYHADDADGKVDFKSATRIECAEPGDVIATLHPPTNGENGISLKGNSIPARNGKPKRIAPGEGIEFNEDNQTFVAKMAGRPLLKGQNLVISPELQIPGDVDYEVGNIDFQGVVRVDGNVLDGFSIKADAIYVHGLVGGATLLAEQSITIDGGINGQGRADITAGGDLFAKYINQASVTAHGVVSVRREIVNSKVRCHGKVVTGKILGGECLALGGIEAAILGSDLGVNTLLEPGADYQLREVELLIDQANQKIETFLRPIENFLGDRARFKSLPEEKQEEIRKNYEEFKVLKEQHLECWNKRNAILADESYKPDKTVRVLKTIFPDVLVRTDLCMQHFTKETTGPLILEEEINTASFKINALKT